MDFDVTRNINSSIFIFHIVPASNNMKLCCVQIVCIVIEPWERGELVDFEAIFPSQGPALAMSIQRVSPTIYIPRGVRTYIFIRNSFQRSLLYSISGEENVTFPSPLTNKLVFCFSVLSMDEINIVPLPKYENYLSVFFFSLSNSL